MFVKNTTGFFGPICTDDWDDTAATVVCRQLDYSEGEATYNEEFGPVPTQFSITKVNCTNNGTGTPKKLQECTIGEVLANHTCTSTDGAGVRCFNKLGGGTCSIETEEKLYTRECQEAIAELPRIIVNTVVDKLLKNSCNPHIGRCQDLFPKDCQFQGGSIFNSFTSSAKKAKLKKGGKKKNIKNGKTEGKRNSFKSSAKKAKLKKGGKKKNSKNSKIERKRKRTKGSKKNKNHRRTQKSLKDNRLTPIEEIEVLGNVTNVVSPNIKFEHTRHRYSWICSLRTKGTYPEHLCAVTLLSVPPRPTVVVGAAHCTFLCKDPRGFPLDSCCCSDAGLDCSSDTVKCGNNATVYKGDFEGKNTKLRTNQPYL